MAAIQATIVFEANWNAIHATNPDGTRKYKYIVNEGSSRSSKTHSIMQCLYLYAMQNANKRLSVFRATKKTCKDTIGNDMLKLYPTMPNASRVGYNKTDSVFLFHNKSVIEVNGTDNADLLHGYNGNATLLNEPYDISKDTFDQIDMRMEDFIILDWNPKQAHWIDDLKKDPRTLVISSTFKDNPFCPPEQKIKILSYQPVKYCQIVIDKILPEVETKAYDITENALHFTERQLKELLRCKENERKNSSSEFNWCVYGLGTKSEKPNRIFHWTEISDDDYNKIDAKKYYGVDWGVVDPWGILEAKYLDGSLYLKELNYKSENVIKQELTMHEILQVNAKEEGLVAWMFEKLQIPKNATIVCDDNRAMKIVALRGAGYDYAIAASKGPGSILDGLSTIEKLNVYFTSSSLNIKYEQENYSRIVDRHGVTLEDPEDAHNHIAGDPTRYIVAHLKQQGIIKII